jgi:beta-phosphoglucomutase-like phosphatase (HAD superfamily)
MNHGLASAEVLLCDADGNLFASEEPAFVASARVTNRMLAELGIQLRFDARELRRFAMGRNFRATATELAARHGLGLDPVVLERYVADERSEVTAHLAAALRPDPDVRDALVLLWRSFRLAAVSSSASERLDTCFDAAGLSDLFPRPVRFSAEDSLPAPASKPDPAIYLHAGAELGVAGPMAIAVEDAVAGVRSAVSAGFPTIGNLVFVAAHEREERAESLRAAGAVAIVDSWWELVELVRAARAEAA